MRTSIMAALAVLALGPTGCANPSAAPDPTTPATSRPTTPPTAAAGPKAHERVVEGTVVRFSAGSESVDVTIDEDSPAARDFLTMLPTTLTLEEFSGREKIAYLPRDLDHGGTTGSDPEDGDLIYFVPWGNLGFYYETSGVGFSDQTLHLGTYDASRDELTRLEGRVSVAVVELPQGPKTTNDVLTDN